MFFTCIELNDCVCAGICNPSIGVVVGPTEPAGPGCLSR